MYHLKRKILTALVAIALSGCVTLSSSPVTTVKLSSMQPAPREISILNGTPYLAEMTLSLAKLGFKVKPISSLETITEQKSATVSSQWKQAATRYAMVFQIEGTRQICAFTDYRIVNATVNVVDVKTNESVAILKQRGSDGPCTTVTPVFDSLAEEISKLWN